ncbi:MAG: hypothetical protein AB7W47_11410 [Calditrichaceae bacterium]
MIRCIIKKQTLHATENAKPVFSAEDGLRKFNFWPAKSNRLLDFTNFFHAGQAISSVNGME